MCDNLCFIWLSNCESVDEKESVLISLEFWEKFEKKRREEEAQSRV